MPTPRDFYNPTVSERMGTAASPASVAVQGIQNVAGTIRQESEFSKKQKEYERLQEMMTSDKDFVKKLAEGVDDMKQHPENYPQYGLTKDDAPLVDEALKVSRPVNWDTADAKDAAEYVAHVGQYIKNKKQATSGIKQLGEQPTQKAVQSMGEGEFAQPEVKSKAEFLQKGETASLKSETEANKLAWKKKADQARLNLSKDRANNFDFQNLLNYSKIALDDVKSKKQQREGYLRQIDEYEKTNTVTEQQDEFGRPIKKYDSEIRRLEQEATALEAEIMSDQGEVDGSKSAMKQMRPDLSKQIEQEFKTYTTSLFDQTYTPASGMGNTPPRYTPTSTPKPGSATTSGRKYTVTKLQ
jgi:hypothetical protein